LKYVSPIAGIVALGIEVLVFMSLMEMPPFRKGSSDIVWGLPFFGLLVFALAIFGLAAALSARRTPTQKTKLAAAGLLLNGLSLAIPMLMLVLAVGRLLVS
jgi:hypothetical protein